MACGNITFNYFHLSGKHQSFRFQSRTIQIADKDEDDDDDFVEDSDQEPFDDLHVLDFGISN